MSEACIKGTAFRSVVEDIKRLIDAGELCPEDLARHLSEKDRGFLDCIVTPSGWFPIATYGHMLELLASEKGGGDAVGYLRRRGARAAEQLLSGTYESLAAEARTWGPRVGQTMVGISKLLYNFMSWDFREVENEVFDVETRDAADFPETARYTAEGFLHWFAVHAAGRPMRVESRRPSPDRLIFRLEPERSST
jgi:hypothetical protein